MAVGGFGPRNQLFRTGRPPIECGPFCRAISQTQGDHRHDLAHDLDLRPLRAWPDDDPVDEAAQQLPRLGGDLSEIR